MMDVQFEYSLPLAIFLGILASILLNLGKGVQRLGAETLGKDIVKKWRENTEDRRKIIKWLIGTVMATLSSVVQVAAQMFLDRPSTFVALGGIGILSVVFFSFYVIKEKISVMQIAGIAMICVGTVLLGIEYNESTLSLPDVNFYLFSIYALIFGVVIAIVSIKARKGYGIVFGTIAGLFNAFAAILTEFSVATGNRELVSSIVNPWLIISLFLGQGAFWTTQYAFKKGGYANVVVPAMNSFLILIPFINDTIIYGIPFGIFQILAFILNIAGIILLCLASSAILNRLMTPIQITPKDKDKEVTAIESQPEAV
ncbi:MAG TPA: hypothetical protein VKM55_15750 [Candidatus Lokiarchaeia archaeon]|nr:hypothetical protein [Candidatus Lokiarchaeia archaeon]